jgi:hypothetical protein
MCLEGVGALDKKGVAIRELDPIAEGLYCPRSTSLFNPPH